MVLSKINDWIMEKEVYIRILDEVTNYDAFCIN